MIEDKQNYELERREDKQSHEEHMKVLEILEKTVNDGSKSLNKIASANPSGIQLNNVRYTSEDIQNYTKPIKKERIKMDHVEEGIFNIEVLHADFSNRSNSIIRITNIETKEKYDKVIIQKYDITNQKFLNAADTRRTRLFWLIETITTPKKHAATQ